MTSARPAWACRAGPPVVLRLGAVSVDPSAPAWVSGPPPAEWLAAVNRQSLAVRLLATAVHDVNNILQVMSGAAEVLALDPTPAAVAKRTTSIVGQSAAATAVLHNLMAFLRADAPASDGARPLALAQQVLAFRQHAFKKLRLTVVGRGRRGRVRDGTARTAAGAAQPGRERRAGPGRAGRGGHPAHRAGWRGGDDRGGRQRSRDPRCARGGDLRMAAAAGRVGRARSGSACRWPGTSSRPRVGRSGSRRLLAGGTRIEVTVAALSGAKHPQD